jgi:HSP20 family molecular chaperone IbpA
MSIPPFVDDTEILLEKLKKRPDLLGMQHMLIQLEHFVKFTNDQNYPLTNIERKQNDIFVIHMALAGFKKNQLNINLIGHELIVEGKKDKEETPRNFIQKSIAFRNFSKKFLIGANGKILEATYNDGLLQINIHIPNPAENEQIQNIIITEDIKEDI